MKLISSQRISRAHSKHSAFTDMVAFKDQYYVCYRQASNHVSKDGIIVILVSSDLTHWQELSRVSQYRCDLRDPKLSVTPDNKLCLLFYLKLFDSEGVNRLNQCQVSLSVDGQAWSAFKALSDLNWWLWRITWSPHQPNHALGVAYNRRANRVRLFEGDPRRRFECTVEDLFSLSTQGKGYPNESDILFLPQGTALCLLRRDADNGSAQLGIAKAPYKKWRWIDLHFYLGGPNLLQLSDGRLMVCGRVFSQQKGPLTYLFELQLTQNNLSEYSAKLKPILALPSKGDNAYPAMLEHNNHLYISYYSQHESRPCAIYLAKVAL